MKTVLNKGGLLEHFLTTYTSVWQVYGLIAILFVIVVGASLATLLFTGHLGIWLLFSDQIHYYPELRIPAIILMSAYVLILVGLCSDSVKKYTHNIGDSVLTQNNFVKIIKMRYSAIKNKYCNIIEWKEKDE